MVTFIIGCCLAAIVIFGAFGLCFYLIKRADYIKKVDKLVYVVITILIVLGFAAIFLILYQ